MPYPGSVEKGFNRVPKHNTTSASLINSIAAFEPLYPNGPENSGCEPGNASLC